MVLSQIMWKLINNRLCETTNACANPIPIGPDRVRFLGRKAFTGTLVHSGHSSPLLFGRNWKAFLLGALRVEGLLTPSVQANIACVFAQHGIDSGRDDPCSRQPGPGPGPTITPSSIDFGRVPIKDIATRTLTIVNTSGSPVTLSFPRSPSGSFSWHASNLPVAVGERKVVAVEFAPRGQGLAQTTLIITSTPAGSRHSIRLSGRGVRGVPPR
jgi:hypothetical protein